MKFDMNLKFEILHESGVAQPLDLPLQLVFPLLHLLTIFSSTQTSSNKFTFLFKRMTKAQMKILMARLTMPMATTRMERLSTVKPSGGKSTWGPGVNVMFPLLRRMSSLWSSSASFQYIHHHQYLNI